MKIETRIKLDKWKPRDYQLPILEALEQQGYKKLLVVMGRRAGKDVTMINLMLRAALRDVGHYVYCLPTFSQARRVCWQGKMNTGEPLLSFIPDELILKKNDSEMRIELQGGSSISFIGSDTYDRSIVGQTFRGLVISEAALCDLRAYSYARPILASSNGWVVLTSTPRGKNSFYELYQIAISNPDEWFVYKKGVDETNHIPLSVIEQEKAEGVLSEDMVASEYYCSWDQGVEGSYYSRYIDRARVKGQISDVPWESAWVVHVAFDIGVRDACCLIFYQVIGQTVRLIDCYTNVKHGLEHYVNVIKQKEYTLGKVIMPHDIKVKEFGSGLTRLDMAKRLGLNVTIAPNIPVEDGIESVRAAFSRIWIDEKNCAKLIVALQNYRQEWDAKKRVYNPRPLHDVHSNFADAMRYLVLSLPKMRDGMSPQDTEKLREAAFNPQANMPKFYQDTNYGDGTTFSNPF